MSGVLERESQIVRVAVVGDLHIGAPVRQLEMKVSEKKVRSLAYYATERLIETVAETRPDAVLITGDLFDRTDGSARALELGQRIFDEWSDHGRPIVAISGNHDVESELPARLRLPDSARWLSADHAETVSLPELGLAVHGMSVRDRDDLRQVIDDYPAPVAGAFNIAMLHSSLDGKWSMRDCLPVPLERLQSDGRYQAWALGHVHRRLKLHENPAIVYPGGVHAKRENAAGARGFAMIEIDFAGALTAAGHTGSRLTEVDIEVDVEYITSLIRD